jgi:hypothetical protein
MPQQLIRSEDSKMAPDSSGAPSTICADRFRRANELRREGAAEQAARFYEELSSVCAGSSEDVSARVLVGRIYLDRLSDPNRALAAFASYLAAASNGSLREDAMIGRALALGRLNRAPEEESAWRALLSSYPDSLYAQKAKSRLNELE